MNIQEINDDLDTIIRNQKVGIDLSDKEVVLIDVSIKLNESRETIIELCEIIKQLLIGTMPEKRFKR